MQKQKALLNLRIKPNGNTIYGQAKIRSVPDPYYLDKKVKLVELFSYHKLGLTNKYTHLFGDS